MNRSPRNSGRVALTASRIIRGAIHGPRVPGAKRRSAPIVGMLATLLVCLSSSAMSAQSRATTATRLGPVLAQYPGQFTQVISVRELGNGSVLVVDEMDEAIFVLREGTAVPESVVRRGSGPGEAREIARVWPLGADTSIMKDHSMRRLLVFIGPRAVTTLGASDPLGQLAARERLIGVDGRGGLYYSAFRRDRSGRADIYDSTVVLRVDRARFTIDTVAILNSGFSQAAPPRVEAGGGARGAPRYSMAMTAPDQAAVFPDGTVAIARTNPYRVDWCSPTGGCRIGPPIAAGATDYRVADKEALLKLSESQATWPPTTRVDETVDWPTVKPPFHVAPWARDFSAVLPAPTGELLVLRTPSAGTPGMSYDVVDRTRGLIGTIAIPSNERLVAFGQGAAYVAVIDADGIQRLVRRSWR